jgi:hypothetical protein
MRRERGKVISIGTILVASVAVLGWRLAHAGKQQSSASAAGTVPATGFLLVLKTQDMGQPVFNCPASAAIPETLPAGELIELDPQ